MSHQIGLYSSYILSPFVDKEKKPVEQFLEENPGVFLVLNGNLPHSLFLESDNSITLKN